MKSISITRLKRLCILLCSVCGWPEMKSISITRLKRASKASFIVVSLPEMKSISITRLKHPILTSVHHPTLITWNEKHLDYEIETWHSAGRYHRLSGAWNEKHLDYEIETKWRVRGACDYALLLKWKASRLRDWNCQKRVGCAAEISSWNEKHLDYEIETRSLASRSEICSSPEMKSISITRLKLSKERIQPVTAPPWNEKHLDYEIETRYGGSRKRKASRSPEMTSISITRLKLKRREGVFLIISLKWQASRLRDWNLTASLVNAFRPTTPEMTSISITRLKLPCWIHSRCHCHLSWNDKHLDYEIETKGCASSNAGIIPSPEMTSISITRLKQDIPYEPPPRPDDLKWQASRLRDWNHKLREVHFFLRSWNDKHLDYEIETRLRLDRNARLVLSWNDKHLDYEIETVVRRPQNRAPVDSEMTSISITRLKQRRKRHYQARDSRTWNEKHLDYEIETYLLSRRRFRMPIADMTSISIARLKQTWVARGCICKCVSPEMKSISMTRLKRLGVRAADYTAVEMKSLSMTRLKHARG